MKKFYSIFATMLLALVSIAAVAQDAVQFNIEIDDASKVYLTKNGERIDLQNGENIITAEPNEWGYFDSYYLCLQDSQNDYFSNITLDGETWASFYGATSYDVYIYVSEDLNGKTLHPTVKSLAEMRTATLNVTVDDASKIRMRMGSYEPALVDGENAIKFNPETENRVEFMPTVSHIGGITLNGENLEYQYGSYSAYINDGDNIVITTAFETEAIDVTFKFTNDGTQGAINAVYMADGYTKGEQLEIVDGKITVDSYSRIIVSLNQDNYNISAFIVNGEPQYVSPWNNDMIVEIGNASTEIEVTAEALQTSTIDITLTNPAHVIVKTMQSEYEDGNTIEGLVAGKNTVEISGKVQFIKVVANDYGVIDKVEATDAEGTTTEVEAYYEQYKVATANLQSINVVSHAAEYVTVKFDPEMKDLVNIYVGGGAVAFGTEISTFEGSPFTITAKEGSNIYAITVNGVPAQKGYDSWTFTAAKDQYVSFKQLSTDGGLLTINVNVPEDNTIVYLQDAWTQIPLKKGVQEIPVPYSYDYGQFYTSPVMIAIADAKADSHVISSLTYTQPGSDEQQSLWGWTEDGGASAVLPVIKNEWGTLTVYDGCTFYPTVKNIKESRTATATVNIIGDREVLLNTGNFRREVVPGENTIMFDPEAESNWTIEAGDYEDFESVTLNGTEIESEYGRYSLYYVYDGSVIEINTVLDKSDKTVKFEFADEASRKAIKSVTHYNDMWEEVEFEGWDSEDGLTVPFGTQITVNFNTDAYDVDYLTINGIQESLWGSYIQREVKKNLTFFVHATALTMNEIEIELTDPAHVKVGFGEEEFAYGADTYAEGLVAGTNTVQVSSKMKSILVYANNGCIVDKVEIFNAEGESAIAEETFEGSNIFRASLDEVVKVVIESHAKERNDVATIWCDEVPFGYSVMRGDYSDIFGLWGGEPLVPGENVFNFDAATENPIRISCYNENYDQLPLFLNNERQQAPEYGGFELELKDGDYIQVFSSEDIATAITTVKTNAQTDAVYNMQGMKVQNAKNLPAGIYIMNGKKVVIK